MADGLANRDILRAAEGGGAPPHCEVQKSVQLGRQLTEFATCYPQNRAHQQVQNCGRSNGQNDDAGAIGDRRVVELGHLHHADRARGKWKTDGPPSNLERTRSDHQAETPDEHRGEEERYEVQAFCEQIGLACDGEVRRQAN